MRRYILGPVIMCLLVIGLVGADYGQIAQAQTSGKKDNKSLASKEAKTSKKAEGNTQAAATTKKLTSSKKKIKAKHVSDGSNKKSKKKVRLSAGDKKHHSKAHHVSAADHKKSKKSQAVKKHRTAKSQHRPAHKKLPSKQVNFIRPVVEEYQLPSPQPSDLWLARDCPDTYKELLNLEQPDDLTIKILTSAYSFIGTPYRHGGTTPNGFDCSGFVRYVFRENGILLGRSSRDQAQEGKSVQVAELKAGDLIFFNMRSRRKDNVNIDHVGLYVGNGRFIHASGNRRAPEIRVEGLESKNYLPKIVEVRRVLDEEQRLSSDLSY